MKKYYFIADASFNDKYYKTGKEYELTESEYINLKGSCEPVDQRPAPKPEGITTTNMIVDKGAK